MATRKVEITVNAKDLSKVIEDLKVKTEDLEFTLQVDVEDSKETYKYLIESGLIKNWELREDPEETCQEKPENTMKKGVIGTITDAVTDIAGECMENVVSELLKNSDHEKFIGNIYKFLYYTYRIVQTSPGFRFGKVVIRDVIAPKMINSDNVETVESLAGKKLIGLYYSGYSDQSEVVRDIIAKVKNNWRETESLGNFMLYLGRLFNA